MIFISLRQLEMAVNPMWVDVMSSSDLVSLCLSSDRHASDRYKGAKDDDRFTFGIPWPRKKRE